MASGKCRIGDVELIDFGSNDYLGLSFDARVVSAAKQAIEKYGTGARASSLISGRSPVHVELEEALCEFEDQSAAILFPSGYAANLGVITALVGEGDIVFCDRLNHACLVDGCRLSGAKLRVYRHDHDDRDESLNRLETELKKADHYRRRLIVTDGVFSMDGEFAPLPELCDLAEKYNAMLLVDEAHGTGTIGPRSRGACDHFQVEDRVTIRVGTLSKAVGSQGGFATGPKELIEWLWNSSRTQMFSTALCPAACAAAAESVRLIRNEPQHTEQLKSNVTSFRKRLIEIGIQALGHEESPIVPIIFGDAVSATQKSSHLLKAGFFVPAIRPPTVPRGTSRLRITISSVHNESDLNRLVNALSNIMKAGAGDE